MQEIKVGEPIVIDLAKVMEEGKDGIRLNIGCGTDIIKGFINVDPFSPFSQAPWDAGELPLRDNSVDLIISNMVIEHFPQPRVVPILTEWYRVLKKGGKLVIQTTDLIEVCRKTVETAKTDLNLSYLFGSQVNEGQYHYCGFTAASMLKCLAAAGFTGAIFSSPDAPWLGEGYHDLLVMSEK